MKIQEALGKFGLSENEQEVYLLLLKRGWSTALQLARAGNVKRTTLYRVLETLAQKGLVETQIDDKTTYYNASDPKQFESLVIREESKANGLREVYEDLDKSIKILAEAKRGETVVRFYRGLRGLESLEWKTCEKRNTEIYIFDSGDVWYEKLGREFAEKIRAEVVIQNIQIREIHNTEFDLPMNEDGTCTWTDNTKYTIGHYRHRSISGDLFSINQDIYIIGGNIVHLHGYRDEDIFGMEVISEDFSKMMSQLFKMLWNQAKVIDKFGGENI